MRRAQRFFATCRPHEVLAVLAALTVSCWLPSPSPERPALTAIRELNQIDTAENRKRVVELATEALARDEALEDSLRGSLLVELGLAHGFLGQFDESIVAFEKALPLLRQPATSRELAYATSSYATSLLGDQRYLAALHTLREARELFRQQNDLHGEGEALANLGALFAQGQQFGEALLAYEEGLEIWRQLGDQALEAHTAHNLAELFLALGRPRRTLELCEASLPGVAQWPAVRAHTLEHMGVAWAQLDDLARAEEHLEAALAIEQEHGFEWAQARTLLQLAALDENREEPARAQHRYRQALRITQRLDNRLGTAEAEAKLGMLALTRGDHPEAARLLALSLNAARHHGFEAVEILALAGTAELLAQQGDVAAALSNSLAALKVLENQRQRSSDADLRASYFATKRAYYDQAVALVLRTERGVDDARRAQEVFELAERARARSLLDSLPRAGVRESSFAPPPVLERTAAWRASSSGEKVSEPSRETKEWRDLLTQLRRDAPQYGRLFHPQPRTASEVQQLLDADTVLVHLLAGRSDVHAVVTSRRDSTVHNLGATAAIHPWMESLSSALQHPGRRQRAELDRAALRLYDLLVRPLEPHLAVRRLILVLDEPFLAVPLETLATGRSIPQRADGIERVVDRWTVSSVPSASVLAEVRLRTAQRRRESARLHFVGFAARSEIADDLPASATEVSEIASHFAPGTARVLTDSASALAALHQLPATRILHFSGHSEVNEESPDLSLLSLGEGEGSSLRVGDVYSLSLDADLVVLAACETGRGPRQVGEGYLGFTRGFLHAGATALVASLWRVADQPTAAFMNSFYAHLRAGEPSDEALRAAKLELMRDEQYAHPYYWAPFVLVGDGGSATSL